jgi:hypothetical protein
MGNRNRKKENKILEEFKCSIHFSLKRNFNDNDHCVALNRLRTLKLLKPKNFRSHFLFCILVGNLVPLTGHV